MIYKKQETLTFYIDKRFFTFFEPRLLNIDLFHRHITKSISLQHKISNHLLTETQLATSKINPTYSYNFDLDNKFSTLQLKHSLRPFKTSEWFKSQLVLISRYAIGNMKRIDRYQVIEFNTLEKLY